MSSRTDKVHPSTGFETAKHGQNSHLAEFQGQDHVDPHKKDAIPTRLGEESNQILKDKHADIPDTENSQIEDEDTVRLLKGSESPHITDPYFGQAPITFNENENGWNHITKAILTKYPRANKNISSEELLTERIKHNDPRRKKLSDPNVKKSVNFLDPQDLHSSIKHMNQNIFHQKYRYEVFKNINGEEENIEEIRNGLIQRKKDIFLAALNQPYHTKKFLEVMNQINQMSISPEKLKNLEELKDYNHVVKIQKRILAQKMQPTLDHIKDKVAVVGKTHEHNSIDLKRDLLILENEEENPHYQPRMATLPNEELLAPEREIRSEASLEFSRMIDSGASEIVDFLDSPVVNKPTLLTKDSKESSLGFGVGQGNSPIKFKSGEEIRKVLGGEESRKAGEEVPNRRSAPSFTWNDSDPKKSATFHEKPAKVQRLPRYRRKSDISHYYGGECKKLAAVSHIILLTDIKHANNGAESVEKDELLSMEKIKTTTRMRSQTVKKDRSNKTLTNLDLRGRIDSFNLQKQENQITEEVQPQSSLPSQRSNSPVLQTKPTGTNKSENFRVLLNSDKKVHDFVPISGLKTSLGEQTPKSVTPRKEPEKKQVDKLELNEDDFANRFLVFKTERRKMPMSQQSSKPMGRSASQPKVRNAGNREKEPEGFEKNKELKLGLDAVMKLNGKAKLTLFKNAAQSKNSQKLPPLSHASQGVGLAQAIKFQNEKKNNNNKMIKRSASVVPERKYSFENFEIDRNQPPQPYLSHLPYCRPANDPEVRYEAYEVGIGPKFGPFQSEFKYDKMSQTAIKIRRKGSNFYIRS